MELDEMYAQVREHLRQQHDANTQEIYGKKVDNFNNYRYYGNDDVKQDKTSSSMFSFKAKACFFFVSVMLFSFYIYGGQDVERGAKMAWNEMKTQIIQLEKEEPAVKQAMSYVRKAYDEVEDFTKTYINIGE